MEHSHPTVLLVEDDPLLAMDVEAVLRGAGYEVLGPAGSAADALSILREETPDVAILDIHLGGETAFAVFDDLDGRGRPFIILSGHSRQVVPPRHARRPFLQKPCDARLLLRTLSTALGEGSQNIASAIG